jgi:GT2 family glycosyltransferase
VIPSYQGGKDLMDCLSSVSASERLADFTMVVDNASSDGSVEEASRAFADVEFVRNPENKGFGAACNQGIQTALNRGMDYVLLLNQDALLEPGALGSMISLAEREERAAAIGNKTLFRDAGDSGKPKLFYNGSYRTSLPLWQRIPGIGLRLDPDDIGPRKVDYVWGHAMLLRSEALREAGAFDEAFFMYYEDIDLCLRFQNAGWQNWCDGDSVTWHSVEDHARAVNPEAWRWQLKMESSLYFYRKHSNRFLAPWLWLSTAFRHCVSFLRQRRWAASWQTVVAVCKVMLGTPIRPPGTVSTGNHPSASHNRR